MERRGRKEWEINRTGGYVAYVLLHGNYEVQEEHRSRDNSQGHIQTKEDDVTEQGCDKESKTIDRCLETPFKVKEEETRK